MTALAVVIGLVFVASVSTGLASSGRVGQLEPRDDMLTAPM